MIFDFCVIGTSKNFEKSSVSPTLAPWIGCQPIRISIFCSPAKDFDSVVFQTLPVCVPVNTWPEKTLLKIHIRKSFNCSNLICSGGSLRRSLNWLELDHFPGSPVGWPEHRLVFCKRFHLIQNFKLKLDLAKKENAMYFALAYRKRGRVCNFYCTLFCKCAGIRVKCFHS